MAFTDRVVEYPNRISLAPVTDATNEIFTADGVTTAYGFSANVTAVNSVEIDGAETEDYTFSDNTITFTTAPTAGAVITCSVVASNVYDMKRAEGSIIQDGTPLNAESLTTEITTLIDTEGPQIQAGRVSVACKANTVVKKTVNFSKAFSKVPVVCVTVNTTTPQKLDIGIDKVTATGFTICVYRTADATNTLHWIATI